MNRNRLTTVVALLLVPLLIAGGFLWGTSRLDADLRRVQAAVVNNDEMVTINGQVMPLGRQLAAELVDSDRDQNVTWVLASEEKAAEGLKSGRYAAVVRIPKEFSAAASSFSKPPSEAVHATITVETSPVAGLTEAAIGRSIAEAASVALNRFLTGEYLKNIYLGFNQMHEQMLTLADGTRKLADGADQLADGADQSADGADKLSDGLGQASAGSPQLRKGAAASASGAQQLADGLGLASAGGARLREGVQSASSGAGQLSGGARQLADGSRQWADGAQQFATGADQLAAGADRYATGVQTYADGVARYVDGVRQYTNGVDQIVRPVRDAIARIPEWGGWLADAEAAVLRLTDEATAADAQVQAWVAQARAYVKQAMGLAADADAVRAGVATVDTKAAALAQGTLACPTELTDAECAAFRKGVAAAGASLGESVKPLATKAGALDQQAADVQKAGQSILDVLDKISTASTKLVQWAPQAKAELERIRASIPAGTPRTKADVMALLDQFLGAGEQLRSGGAQLAAGGTELADGGRQLADGATGLAGGARKLADGARGLASGTDQLAGGIDALASGLAQLSRGVDAYTGGIDDAARGASQLAGGLGQLSSGVDAYTRGIDQAAGGASLLADGLGQLSDGAGQLADGTDELANGVADGVDKMPTYTDSERDRLSGVVAAPVSTDGLSFLERPELAWVTLLTTTALWIGSLATFAATGRLDRRAALSTAPTGALVRRSLLPGLGIVAAQAVLLALMASVALGLTPTEGALSTVVLLVAGVAFALVNAALAWLFGNGGRVAALAMAVVTAVTATTATAPGIFEALRSLSPLSPALEALRAVSTTQQVLIPVFVLVGWAVVGLAGCVAAVARTRTVPLAQVAARA